MYINGFQNFHLPQQCLDGFFLFLKILLCCSVFEPLNNNIYNNNEYSNIKLIFKFLCLYEFEDVPYLCIEVIHHNSVYDFCPLFLLHYSYN